MYQATKKLKQLISERRNHGVYIKRAMLLPGKKNNSFPDIQELYERL